MSSPGLLASIAAVTIYGQIVEFPNPVSNYFGQPLYVSSITIDAAGLLVFTIDDVGPNCLQPKQVPASVTAYATLSLGHGKPVQSAATKITYRGGAITISAQLGVGTGLSWTVQPVIAEFVPNPQNAVPMYVLVGEHGTLWEMRWIDPPIAVSQIPATVRIIPETTGSSSLGPFGLQTP